MLPEFHISKKFILQYILVLLQRRALRTRCGGLAQTVRSLPVRRRPHGMQISVSFYIFSKLNFLCFSRTEHCPRLACEQQETPPNQCCPVCTNLDYCSAQSNPCHSNAMCENGSFGAKCACKQVIFYGFWIWTEFLFVNISCKLLRFQQNFL
jgi:hypothetical protein